MLDFVLDILIADLLRERFGDIKNIDTTGECNINYTDATISFKDCLGEDTISLKDNELFMEFIRPQALALSRQRMFGNMCAN